MSKRRSRLEITLTILSTIRDGVEKPTRIMYATNMSWKPVKRTLSHLVEQGLLVQVFNTESRQSRIRYQKTEKGKKVLDYFENADAIMPLEDIYADD